MKIDGKLFRTIWPEPSCNAVQIINQTRLPHAFEIKCIASVGDMVTAIKTMEVRGAPLIGAAAAYGVALAMWADAGDASLDQSAAALLESRPTAVNLRWALQRMCAHL